MIVRLPSEWEWEIIAKANGLENGDRPSQKNLGPLEAGSFHSGKLELYDMDGNLWEWCENGFGMNDSFLYNTQSTSTESEFVFPDFAVRGGSWANNPGQVELETRGSQPASWCTAYVGFRPLLLVKR
jgi:formylglycine-generating enzyme required for sulfatase activity